KKQAAKSVVQTLQENQGFEQIAVLLTQYGIGLKKAQEIYFIYKQETLKYIQENPYQFIYDIEGITFQTADKIAKLNGIATTRELRIRASVVHADHLTSDDGHVYLPLEECNYTMIDIINQPSITRDFLKEPLNDLPTEKTFTLVEDKVYLTCLYYGD